MTIQEIDTPAILIDLDIMERNLRRTAEYAAMHGLRLRPHTKTHKIPALGSRQLELGAAGLSVAKTTEAEVMLATGTPDILVAYPVIGPAKLERLSALARRTNVTVALDSTEAARSIAALDAGIGVLAEVDVGLRRVGVAPEDAPAFVSELRHLNGVEWKGIAFYPGHIKDPDDDRGVALLAETVGRLLDDLGAAGHRPEIVSGGSTPLLWRSHQVAGMNEIRPGTYIFNDRSTRDMGACEHADCAATVLATVVSVQHGRMMIDGGSKTFSSDRLATGGEGFGELLGAPGALFHKMNEEHGFIDLSACETVFHVGDRVRVLPNHICTAMNLQERVYAFRGGEVVETWRVEGRGKLQ
jgi:D-serine deaminase-like pyridoxal phosphate-dependent protein